MKKRFKQTKNYITTNNVIIEDDYDNRDFSIYLLKYTITQKHYNETTRSIILTSKLSSNTKT